MMLHIYSPQTMSLPGINFLNLMVAEMYPGQDIIGQGHYGKVKSRPHHDVAHLQQCSYQVSTSYTLLFLRYSLDKLFPATSPPIRTPWVKTIPQQPCGLWGKNV